MPSHARYAIKRHGCAADFPESGLIGVGEGSVVSIVAVAGATDRLWADMDVMHPLLSNDFSVLVAKFSCRE